MTEKKRLSAIRVIGIDVGIIQKVIHPADAPEPTGFANDNSDNKTHEEKWKYVNADFPKVLFKHYSGLRSLVTGLEIAFIAFNWLTTEMAKFSGYDYLKKLTFHAISKNVK